MRGFTSNVALLAVLATGACAATIKVEVGKNGGETFSPSSIKAAKGDVVEFSFDSDHNVVAGDFKKPCTPLASGGFYSGTLPSGKNTAFSITINNTDPIFFYCGVEDHCQEGMVGVINVGTDETLADYKTAAAKSDQSENPKSVFGGTVSDGSSSSSSSSTGKDSSATATATDASGTASGTSTSTAAATSSSGAAGQLSGSVVGVSGLVLAVAGVLAL